MDALPPFRWSRADNFLSGGFGFASTPGYYSSAFQAVARYPHICSIYRYVTVKEPFRLVSGHPYPVWMLSPSIHIPCAQRTVIA